MRILIAYRYFHPDTPPYATMLREMSRWLVEAGHDVTIVTAQPSYKPEAGIPRQPWSETRGGVSIRRLPLLAEGGRGLRRRVNSFAFVLMAAVALAFARRPDLIWTASMPPVLQGALLRWIAALRGAKFLYHVQDIYPEIAVASGMMPDGRFSRWLKWLDARTVNAADAIVVPGDDMVASLKARGAATGPVSVINNFAIGAEEPPIDERRTGSGAAVRFIFAGNLGRFQNLEKLVEAFGRIDPALAQLDLVGEGQVKPELEKIVRSGNIGNVVFHGLRTPREAFLQICRSDVAVISLDHVIAHYAFPSKTLTYLAAGRPILALVADDCSLARMIDDAGAGAVLDANASVADVARQIEATARTDLDEMKKSARGLSETFSLERTRAKWLSLMSALQTEDAA